MSLRIANLRLSIDEPESALPGHLARALGIAPAELERWRILRKSLDARVKDAVHFVYTAEVATQADEDRLMAQTRRKHRDLQIDRHAEAAFELPTHGSHPLKHRPIVVGSWDRRGGWLAIFSRSRDISRSSWNGAVPCVSGFRTCTASTPAAHSRRKAIISSAKGAPAHSPTASSPAAAADRMCGACWSCSRSARGSHRSCMIIVRTLEAIACRPWSRQFGVASKRWGARCASAIAGSRIST